MNASFTHQYARRRALHPVLALAMVIAPGVPLVAGAETGVHLNATDPVG